MKIKLFTHTDLDGIGCAILGKIAFENIDIEYCGYNNINQKIMDIDLSGYDLVFITDISVNEDVSQWIDENIYSRVCLFDHHKTALWLNKYDWATVDVGTDEKMESGTSLFYEHLLNFDHLAKEDSLRLFSDTVRKYDCWEWSRLGEIYPKELNDIFKVYGRDRFIDKILSRYSNNEFIHCINSDDLLLLEIEREKINTYIDNKLSQMKLIDFEGYVAGVVFAENYISELGNEICKRSEDIDFCIIVIGNQNLSFRTIKDIDLSVIAKKYGGGGHSKASGCPIGIDLTKVIFPLFTVEE